MTYDVEALAKAAREDTETRLARIRSTNTLGIGAELNAAFLTGWRFAMKQANPQPAFAAAEPPEGGWPQGVHTPGEPPQSNPEAAK
jgi:hypothetical protein